MGKRILDMHVGDVELENEDIGSGMQYTEVLRVTRIADYTNVPRNEKECGKYIKRYLKIQKCKRFGNFGNYQYVPLEKETKLTLKLKTEANELICYLQSALEEDPQNALHWDRLVSAPDWVWIEAEDKCWWHEEPPENARGIWMKYKDYVKKTGYKWVLLKCKYF